MKHGIIPVQVYLMVTMLFTGVSHVCSQEITGNVTGISADVTASNGGYSITGTTPAWTFSGTLVRELSDVSTEQGTDSVGDYQELQFDYMENGAKRGAIRVYQDVPVVLFTKTFVAAAASQGTKFPVFTAYPQRLYVQGYADRWGTYKFDMRNIENTSPAVFFDDESNAFIVSPASCFMDAEMTYSSSSITSGLQSYAEDFPAGYTYTTILVPQHGINAAFDTWGNALTTLNGKKRPANDADVTLEKCGYWTDNKATYYYNYESSRGYEGTLLAVKERFDAADISLGYLQLDSWWYPKGPEESWAKGTGSSDFANGCWEYRAHPELFPNGLADFKRRLGIPLVTHGRWFSNTSPYLSRFENSYTSSYGAVTDAEFWDEEIGGYLEESGVTVYEQDWLDNFAKPRYELNLGETFMDNMARGMEKHNITMQYCMVRPRHYLQAAKYSNVTTMRISQDGFDLSKRDQIFYLSRVARSVGTYPWTDGYASRDLSKLTVVVLTAGVVGFIDAIGAQHNDNILQAVRRDGVIVKPDVPVTATDETYVAHASSGGNGSNAPMVGVTYSDFGETRVQYVYAYNRSGTNSFTFNPDRYGLSGTAVYAYDYRAATGSLIENDAALTGSTRDWAYYILSPIGPSGIAFLGDRDKIASCGTKRISSLNHSANQVSATVAIEPQAASVTLFGYAETQPSAIAGPGGRLGTLEYSAATRLWNVTVTPEASDRGDVVEISVYIGDDPVGVTSKLQRFTPAIVIYQTKNGYLSVERENPGSFSVAVFDVHGRIVQAGSAINERIWIGSDKRIGPGSYIVRVADGSTTTMHTFLVSGR